MTKKTTNKIARRVGHKFEFGLVNHRVRSCDPARLDCLRTFKAIDDDADSVDGVTANSAKLHLRALEILREQSKADNYTAEEYMFAVEKAAA